MTDRLCAVCAQPITPADYWVHHQRLNAAVHGNCPLTDVKGEDISTHTLMWHAPTRGDA